MKPGDFEFVAALVRERSGLVLTADKAYLVESRLAPLARKEGAVDLSALIAQMRARRDERLFAAVTDAMTTNETFFFRDKTPFDILRDVALPEIIARKKGQPIRIWCAAASTGQEPYSIAMLMDEAAPKLGGASVEIFGTDISDRCLEKASAGVYTQFEVQRGLPIQMLLKHFEKKDDVWRIKDRIRSMVKYRKANLLDGFSAFGKFDIVFCRNVLIYFDPATKKQVLERIAVQTVDPGYLFLGAAETVMGLTDAFRSAPNQRGLYIRTGAAAARAA